MRGRICRGALALGIVMLAAGSARAVVIGVGSASGGPGAQVTIDVTLATEGGAVLATQNRIGFTRQAYIPAGPGGAPLCAVNPAIDKEATAFRFLPLECDPATDCESVRAFVLSFGNLAPIDDGALLYTCAVQIAAAAPGGAYPLTNDEIAASASMGVLLPASGTSGVISVEPQPAAEVRIGAATGEPGDTVEIAVTLAQLDQGAAVAGVQADFGFTAATPVTATPDGTPDCTLDPGLTTVVPSFSFLPLGCTPGDDCSGVRALVFSLGAAMAIADDAVLYTCAVTIGTGTAAGEYPLAAGEMLGSDPDGGAVLLTGVDGAVTVTEPPPPPACPGDCDTSGNVSIDELLLGVNILLGSADPAQCPAMDRDGDASVGVSELILAVNVALGACPL